MLVVISCRYVISRAGPSFYEANSDNVCKFEYSVGYILNCGNCIKRLMSFPIDIVKLLFQCLGRGGANYGATCHRYNGLWLEYIAGAHCVTAMIYYVKYGMTAAAARLLEKGLPDIQYLALPAERDGNPSMIRLLMSHGCRFNISVAWANLINSGNIGALDALWTDQRVSYQALIQLAARPKISKKMLYYVFRRLGVKPRRYIYGDKCVEVKKGIDDADSISTCGNLLRFSSEDDTCLTCMGNCRSFNPAIHCYLTDGRIAYHINYNIERIIGRDDANKLKILLCHAVLREFALGVYYGHALEEKSHRCAAVIKMLLDHLAHVRTCA